MVVGLHGYSQKGEAAAGAKRQMTRKGKEMLVMVQSGQSGEFDETHIGSYQQACLERGLCDQYWDVCQIIVLCVVVEGERAWDATHFARRGGPT